MASTFKHYTALLAPYIAYRSISTDKLFKQDIQQMVDSLENLFEENGFETTVVESEKTNPVIIASYHQSESMKTVLVYGHYDVQPAARQDGWDSDPFSLTEKNGKLYGRGVVDNKGQNLIHIVTVVELIKANKLAYNVVFMLEGNEETTNPDIGKIVEQYKHLLKSDIIIISDGEIVGNTPTIEASLKGGFNACVTITAAPNDLHSGLYGGAAPNPALIAAHAISKIKDIEGYVWIPNFYDDVQPISEEQRRNLARMPSDETVCKMAGLKINGLTCEEGETFYSQVGLRPTIEISGINGGYTGEGFKNIIPATAEFRINFRLVAGQDPETIFKDLERMLQYLIPEMVTYSVRAQGFYPAVTMDVNSPAALNVRRLLHDAYGVEPLIKYVGGGIPIVDDFKTILGVDPLLVSLGNEDCNMHGVNENFDVKLIKKGLAFSWKFFSGA